MLTRACVAWSRNASACSSAPGSACSPSRPTVTLHLPPAAAPSPTPRRRWRPCGQQLLPAAEVVPVLLFLPELVPVLFFLPKLGRGGGSGGGEGRLAGLQLAGISRRG
ncbi:hypothetical protein EJB05_45597, partial [Eragrostis curvula]